VTEVVERYQAMDERRAVKVLLTLWPRSENPVQPWRAGLCVQLGIALLPWSPLGGVRGAG
jgi:hypothetical protein